jgi:hypothetical protein
LSDSHNLSSTYFILSIYALDSPAAIFFPAQDFYDADVTRGRTIIDKIHFFEMGKLGGKLGGKLTT